MVVSTIEPMSDVTRMTSSSIAAEKRGRDRRIAISRKAGQSR